MLFSRELAEEICREMGIKFNPMQEGVTIGGEKLSEALCAEKLFRGEYDFDYEGRFTDTVASVSIPEELNQTFYCEGQKTALAA